MCHIVYIYDKQSTIQRQDMCVCIYMIMATGWVGGLAETVILDKHSNSTQLDVLHKLNFYQAKRKKTQKRFCRCLQQKIKYQEQLVLPTK